MTKPQSINSLRILEPEMRKMFNDGGYWEKVKAGELREVIMPHDDRPAPDHQPPGTRSQMISYRDASDKEIARVHQYLRPDGTLGGRGKPDPKRLLHDGVLYRLVKAKNR
jgi:hypothetical protein